jgi:hypothetical protein
MRSDVPCLEVPCILTVTACGGILRKERTAGFLCGWVDSSVFQPPTHKLWMLPVSTLPYEIDHLCIVPRNAVGM